MFTGVSLSPGQVDGRVTFNDLRETMRCRGTSSTTVRARGGSRRTTGGDVSGSLYGRLATRNFKTRNVCDVRPPRSGRNHVPSVCFYRRCGGLTLFRRHSQFGISTSNPRHFCTSLGLFDLCAIFLSLCWRGGVLLRFAWPLVILKFCVCRGVKPKSKKYPENWKRPRVTC